MAPELPMRALQNCLPVACVIAMASPPSVEQMMWEGAWQFLAGSGPDDLWEIATKAEMSGMSMPAQTSQVCIRKGRNVGEASVPKQDNCKVTEMKTTGNKTTFAMECTGQEPMSMRGETTTTPTTFDTRMSMKGTKKGSDVDMTM